jgi:hypothetical protein
MKKEKEKEKEIKKSVLMPKSLETKIIIRAKRDDRNFVAQVRYLIKAGLRATK